jgi:HEAT repeat protein
MDRTPHAGTGATPGFRSAPELAVLLLELASVVKARSIFSPGDPKLAAVFERCVRAWRSDISRHGALELELTPEGFRQVGGLGLLRHARLGELLDRLRGHSLAAVRFDTDLDGDALAGFVHLLVDCDPSARKGEAFAARLAALVPVGIVARAAQGAAGPVPTAPANIAEASPPQDALAEPATLPSSPDEQFLEADPDSDTMPIEEPEPADALGTLLSELADCTSHASYLDLARRAVTEAERARDAGATYRVLDALAQHIETKEERLGDIARSFLVSQCQGDALRDLLERTARGIGAEQVRAAQILVLIGEPAAAAVLERLPAYPEPVQRERLIPLVLALGERAIPELMQRVGRPERDVARAAAHLLGMLQHPGAVQPLGELAASPDAPLREEAARALMRIGSEEAVAALARALRGPRDVQLSAVQHLAGSASAKAVAPLGHALERALEAKDVDLAKEILRALGRLGRPEANGHFASVMHRKAGLTGRWLRDVKVAAASALASVPGDQAVALLAEALQSRDEPLRKAAQRALDRRAEAVARGSRAVG